MIIWANGSFSFSQNETNADWWIAYRPHFQLTNIGLVAGMNWSASVIDNRILRHFWGMAIVSHKLICQNVRTFYSTYGSTVACQNCHNEQCVTISDSHNIRLSLHKSSWLRNFPVRLRRGVYVVHGYHSWLQVRRRRGRGRHHPGIERGLGWH